MLECQNREVSKFYVVQERHRTDFEALTLRKDPFNEKLDKYDIQEKQLDGIILHTDGQTELD